MCFVPNTSSVLSNQHLQTLSRERAYVTSAVDAAHEVVHLKKIVCDHHAYLCLIYLKWKYYMR